MFGSLGECIPYPIVLIAVQNIVQLGANSIIAGGTVPQVFIAGAFGEGAKVPVVSMASSPFLSGQFLIQMSYPETAFLRCIADIVKSFKWRKVITIYEDDVFGSVSSSVLLLSNALDAIGSELEYRVIFPPSDSLSDPTNTTREQLSKMKSRLSTVYIILRISETLAPILFEEAASQGLMRKGYIWICGNDVTALLDSSFTPTFISKYMQGLVGMRSYINETAPEYVNFQSTFQQRFKTLYGKSGESSFDPGVYAVRAYDVVDAISLAAAASEKNNKSLVENLVASNFSGLSGLVRPTNGSLDERERYSTFHILNVVGRSYREMGIWADGYGFYENEEEFMLRQPGSEKLESIVFWPGGPHTSPSGLRRLKVGVPARNTIWDNFVSVQKTGNSTSYSGFCIDVFTATLSCLNYEVLYDFVPYDIDVYDELVNKVYSREVDIVVGDVTILANRSENVSFTKPYLSSGLAMLVPVEVDRKGWLPTNAFSFALWMCILALLLYYVMLVWLHEEIEGNVQDFQDTSWKEQLGASLWIVSNGIFLNLDKRIHTYQTKIVIILWFFVAQLVLNSFTASLSSILVTQNLRPDVDTKKIGCDGYSFVPDYLTSALNYSSGSIVKIYSASDYKKAFENGTITAAYLEVPYLRVFLSENDNYTVNGETQMLGGFGFVLPKGSLLASDMSEAILMLGENGTLRQLEKKWFLVPLSNYAAPDDDSNQSLGLSNYTYMFVISSCLAFLTVLTRYKDMCRRNTGDQALPPEMPPPPGPPEIELVHHNAPVQLGLYQEEDQQEQPIHDEVLEIEQPLVHEMVHVPPQDGVHNIADHPLELQNDDIRPDMSSPRQRLRHAVSFSNISIPTRLHLPFFSFRKQHREEIEWQPQHDSTQHGVEYLPNFGLHNNDRQPGSSNSSQRFQRAASTSNILTNRVPQHFQSLRPRRASLRTPEE
ncbi:hypothetical protein LUZ61_005911 [Rhynchospora tenuis]|uniref:Ionotropic glutamate receptor C-terminal domain-containing protein n=1 Tax=Rhynchospora tenuis TaxID=198213 RepID=A0AAD6EV09_9POAL|nr:hypothetical protein LUZ61_005911 [Rhynchospora tenuis]